RDELRLQVAIVEYLGRVPGRDVVRPLSLVVEIDPEHSVEPAALPARRELRQLHRGRDLDVPLVDLVRDPIVERLTIAPQTAVPDLDEHQGVFPPTDDPVRAATLAI